MFCISVFFLVSQEPKSFTTHPMALGMPNRCATFINCPPKIIQKKIFGIMYFFCLNSPMLENVFKPKMVNQFYWCLLVCRLYCQINCIIRMHHCSIATFDWKKCRLQSVFYTVRFVTRHFQLLSPTCIQQPITKQKLLLVCYWCCLFQ